MIASLVTFGISLWVLSLFNACQPAPATGRQICLDHRGWLEHPVPPGRGRAQHPAGPADHLPDPHLDPFHLDSGRRAREGLHDLLPAAGSRHDGRLPGAGPVPVLHLLGIHPRPDVLPDRHLGRPAPHVCCHQVLPVHHGRLDPDAAGDPVAGHRRRDLLRAGR